MGENSRHDTQLNWIYEGTKAAVNREDYLLGKRLDKNFELYSDVVNKEKDDNFDVITSGRSRVVESSNTKTSNLEINVVRKEDPLVAIKVKEETLRQEKLENPLFLMRMQRLLKEAMEKKARKQRRKEEKAMKKKKHRKHSSVSDEDSVRNRKKHSTHVKKKHENKKVTKHHHSHRHRRHHHHHNRDEECDDKELEKSAQKVSNMPTIMVVDNKGQKRAISCSGSVVGDSITEKRSSAISAEGIKERDSVCENASTSNAKSINEVFIDKSNTSDETKCEKRKRRMFDSHIPEHLRPKTNSGFESSSSDQNSTYDEELKQQSKSYGLVGVKGDKKGSNTKVVDSQSAVDRQPTNFRHSPQKYVKPSRRKLTEKEKEKKLREMTENAKWRDSSRKQTLKRALEKEQMEEKEEERKPVDFIKPMLNSSGSTMTLEKRLNSTRKALQKDYGYMEKSFVRR